MPVDDSQSLPSDHGHRQEAAKSKTSLATGKSRWGTVRAKLSKLCSHTNPIDTRIFYTGGPKGERVETLNPAAPFDWEHHSLLVNLFKTKVGLFKVKQPDLPPTLAPTIMDLLHIALGSDRYRNDKSKSRDFSFWWDVQVWEDNPGVARNPEGRLPESRLTERLIELPSHVTAPLSNYIADAPDIGWERTFIRWAVGGVEQTIDHLRDLGVQISERAEGDITEGVEAVSRPALTHPLTHGVSDLYPVTRFRSD